MTIMDCRRKSSSTAPPTRFTPLGNNIWFIKATSPPEGPIIDDKDPRLILIFGWMDAKLSHLARFNAGYSALFPHADQLIVGSTSDILIYPKSLLISRMQPLVDKLLSLGAVGQQPGQVPILVHTLSNGGCLQLIHLADLLAQSSIPLHHQPSILVIDSAPGGDDMESNTKAFQSSISSPIIRYPVIALAFVLYGVTYLLGRLPWQIFEPLQMDLLKPQLLPWFIAPSPASRSTPWLFVYSRRDEIVPHHQVRQFVKRVEAIGFKTIQDVYEDTPHVSHMPSDPTRYWTTIRCIWKAHATPWSESNM